MGYTQVVNDFHIEWSIADVANICENRLEIVFVNIEAESVWKAKYVSNEHGKEWLDTTLKRADDDSDHHQSFAKITDQDRGDNDSLILYCDSRWAPPSCWFSEMVKSNPAITSASLEYGEPNLCFVGSMSWDKATNTISETYRTGLDLTDDDWFLLGHDRCLDCFQFLCQCE